MSRLIPSRESFSLSSDREPRLIEIEDDAADAVFDALSPKTARRVFAALQEEPATASDLAETADTSLQNVRYHLDKLIEAGLIEVVDTWYSEQGREMKVYGPADTSLVLVSGGESPERTLRTVLEHFIGGLGVLVLASVLVDKVVRTSLVNSGDDGPDGASGMSQATAQATPTTVEASPTTITEQGTGGGGAGVPGSAPGTTATATPTPTVTPSTTPTRSGGLDGGDIALDLLGVVIPPGALFFLGGLCMLVVLSVVYYYRRQRIALG